MYSFYLNQKYIRLICIIFEKKVIPTSQIYFHFYTLPQQLNVYKWRRYAYGPVVFIIAIAQTQAIHIGCNIHRKCESFWEI